MFLESINIYIHKSYFYLGKCIAYIPKLHFSDLSKMKKKINNTFKNDKRLLEYHHYST